MSVHQPVMSFALCGEASSGKSTVAGHFLEELGVLTDKEHQKLYSEASRIGRLSSQFAMFLDTSMEEREKGYTTASNFKEYTYEGSNYTLIDTPGHIEYLNDMMTALAQADAAVLVVPADESFEASILKGDRALGTIDGHTRRIAHIVKALSLKQLIICVNKMDVPSVRYRESRFRHVEKAMQKLLCEVGFKNDFVHKSVPIIPVSGLIGAGLVYASQRMPWWEGAEMASPSQGMVHVTTLQDAIANFFVARKTNAAGELVLPVAGHYKLENGGVAVVGRIEQGTVSVGDKVSFLSSHQGLSATVESIELAHESADLTTAGHQVGLKLFGLPEGVKPQTGDVMVKNGASLKPAKRFVAKIRVAKGHHVEVGLTATAHVGTAHCACKVVKILAKYDKGGMDCSNLDSAKGGEVAEIVVEPLKHVVVQPAVKNVNLLLSRIVFIDSNEIVMDGKVTKCEFRELAQSS